MCMLHGKVHKCQNVHKCLQCSMHVCASWKGSQMSKCSQVSILATQCMHVFHRKGSQMPKCSQMSTVLNACVCFMERFTNAKMFTSVYTSYSMHVCASGSQMPKCSQMSTVLNACVCFIEKVHKCQNVHIVKCLHYSMHVCASWKGSQISKCSQVSILATQCMCVFHRKGSQMP